MCAELWCQLTLKTMHYYCGKAWHRDLVNQTSICVDLVDRSDKLRICSNQQRFILRKQRNAPFTSTAMALTIDSMSLSGSLTQSMSRESLCWSRVVTEPFENTKKVGVFPLAVKNVITECGHLTDPPMLSVQLLTANAVLVQQPVVDQYQYWK